MSAIAPTASGLRSDGGYFYVRMAAGFLLVAFGGFIPTYWAKVATGTFQGPAVLHIHGMLLFSWVCFYFVQTLLVASGRTLDHRNWGLAGISLFTLVACSVLIGQMAVIKAAEAEGQGEAALRFSAVALCALPVMVGFFTASIATYRRPPAHKRWMTLLLAAMMTPALARLFLTFLEPPGAAQGGPPPPVVSIPPALVADVFVIVAMVRDWRTIGRPHPVYAWGGALLLAQQILTVPLAATSLWMGLARGFEHLAG